jgi:hypothetical protein
VPTAPPVVRTQHFVGPGCPNWVKTFESIGFPEIARAAGLTEGTLLVEFTLETTGRVVNPRVVESTNIAFNAPTITTAEKIVCVGGERDLRVRFSVSYKLQ